MLILDATTSKLEALLNAVATTTNPHFVSCFADHTSTTFTPGTLTGVTNGTTAVTVLAAPAASTQRQLKFMTIYNADSVTHTLTVRFNENATLRTTWKGTLLTGENLVYTPERAWTVLSAAGTVKFTDTAVLG